MEHQDDPRFKELTLPTYSSERFYLLAEIQHAESDLVFGSVSKEESIAFKNAFDGSSLKVRGVAVVCIYLLVTLSPDSNLETEAEKLVQRARELAAHRAAAPPLERFLEVDVFLTKGREAQEAAKQFGRLALERLDAAAASGGLLHNGRALSFSDSAVACPGLARVASLCAAVTHPRNDSSDAPRLRVVAEDRAALLGFEPDAEPDAAQGVRQWSVGDLDHAARSTSGLVSKKSKEPRLPREGAQEATSSRLLSLAVNGMAMLAFFWALWPNLPAPFRDAAQGLIPLF
mmetsp:Transcript_26035/g.58362  ORF Transcript_26035/g.58362 Transcript_26035/m.58362 type:complete len:288 (+) Transcript_26035:131-994(+)|eukprot:CAMPEP_0172586614 /NCGR_PEP_ID=MMETSP1068-20121228/5952_1 /TAXON_ID=35684 /ORGANISM="Pseudopedinella elastica, Strain CCMP716" /LENGTH=287 /DNA_ID=CAMNT_0013381469 /DNA_START=126 /DNA_END=989 /DNA_ORIENTATION=-